MNNMNNMGNMNNMNRTSAGYCVKCGTELFAGYKVCPVCATPVGAAQRNTAPMIQQKSSELMVQPENLEPVVQDKTTVPATAGIRGNDIKIDLVVPFLDAAYGAKTKIEYPIKEECPTCNGTGNIQGIACSGCSGRRYIQSKKPIEISIPAGIDNNQTIRIEGMGEPGLNGGERGDFLARVRLLSHPLFTRNGYDIYTTEVVPLRKISMGEELTVTTIDGPYTIRLSMHTSEGQTIKIPRKGIQSLQDEEVRGDHFVRIVCQNSYS